MKHHDYVDWPFSEMRCRQFQRRHWPANADDTLEMSTVWPDAEAVTIQTTMHLPVTATEAEIDADATFRNNKRLRRQK